MISKLTIAAALVAAVAMGPASAKDSQTKGWPADKIGKETTIPFISFNNLYNFEANDDRGVWLQDQSRRWYYAETLGPCSGLPFANRIAVDTRFGGNTLDRTGTLLVDGQRCSLTSLTASNGPPPKAKKSKKG